MFTVAYLIPNLLRSSRQIMFLYDIRGQKLSEIKRIQNEVRKCNVKVKERCLRSELCAAANIDNLFFE